MRSREIHERKRRLEEANFSEEENTSPAPTQARNSDEAEPKQEEQRQEFEPFHESSGSKGRTSDTAKRVRFCGYLRRAGRSGYCPLSERRERYSFSTPTTCDDVAMTKIANSPRVTSRQV